MKVYSVVSFISTLALAVKVPQPPGPYEVAMRVQALMDCHRPANPLNGSDRPLGRPILISVFVPVGLRNDRSTCTTEVVPYMTPKVAAVYDDQAAQLGLSGNYFASFELDFCALPVLQKHNDAAKTNYPVVLFTPGLAESRLLYGSGARSLASYGYLVVTVDHPYEAPWVEFPDKSVIQGQDIDSDDTELLEKILSTRTADLSFVIDSILDSRKRMPSLLGSFSEVLDLRKIVAYGHSLGGAAAASTARVDPRVRGGVDLDGQLVEPIKSRGLSKPFALAGRFNHSSEDNTWNEFWPHLLGPKVELAINGTAHASFTDRQLLSVIDLPPKVREMLGSYIGYVNARELERDVNEVLVRFFAYIFERKSDSLRELPKDFPGISIVRSRLPAWRKTNRR